MLQWLLSIVKNLVIDAFAVGVSSISDTTIATTFTVDIDHRCVMALLTFQLQIVSPSNMQIKVFCYFKSAWLFGGFNIKSKHIKTQ